ncbi:VanZ family protein [Streptomyces sp. NPDC019531]|uniref:VanZ family protein n=1 Tax=Streptomyces sp. NPDC019531 TaxID=3365062 RepID=UPI003850D802
MTETYLLPIRTAALIFPALAFVMFVPTAIVLYRRHGVMTRWRVLSLYGGVFYALTAFCMTIVPLPRRVADVCKAYPTFAEPQFTPGVAFSDIWKEAHHRVTLDALVLHNPAFWQTVFNLLLLVPLGVFVRTHFRRGLAAATVAGFTASLSFELTQYTGLWGLYPCPYRLFAVDDLIVNTAGAALGWAIAGPLVRALPELDALDGRPLAQLAAGRIPFGRRLIALLLDAVGVVLLTLVAGIVALVVTGEAWSLLVPVTVLGLWFVVIPWRTGTTPGKRVLLLRLSTPDGGRPGLAGLALRALALSPVLATTCLAASGVLAGGTVALAVPSAIADGTVNRRNLAYGLAAHLDLRLVLLLLPILCLLLVGGYVRAVRRHPQALGPHEVLSGIHNEALPHTRTRTRPATPALDAAPPIATAVEPHSGTSDAPTAIARRPDYERASR